MGNVKRQSGIFSMIDGWWVRCYCCYLLGDKDGEITFTMDELSGRASEYSTTLQWQYSNSKIYVIEYMSVQLFGGEGRFTVNFRFSFCRSASLVSVWFLGRGGVSSFSHSFSVESHSHSTASM